MDRKLFFGAVLVFTVVTVVARLFPHPANFVPVAALALFAGAHGSSRWILLVPVLAMAVSDLVIGSYTWQVMGSVYGSFLLIGLVGRTMLQDKNVGSVAAGAVAASVLFYLVTNFAVWAFTPMYPPTLQGLLSSYVNAIPFFKNTFLGSLVYSAVFFGGYALLLRASRAVVPRVSYGRVREV